MAFTNKVDKSLFVKDKSSRKLSINVTSFVVSQFVSLAFSSTRVLVVSVTAWLIAERSPFC